ncbi:MAG: hypothetical protein D6710_06025 [Nitrospirae bacterium]|nr:MAG: hypothetical protein D6710_06025 [Nitrospirota bacterium]
MFLNRDLSLKGYPKTYMAGQITGVEGYIESTAMGLIAGINASRKLRGKDFVPVPENSAHGALIKYITESNPEGFQPSNINFGLFSSLKERVKDRKFKRRLIVERALKSWKEYLTRIKEDE